MDIQRESLRFGRCRVFDRRTNAERQKADKKKAFL